MQTPPPGWANWIAPAVIIALLSFVVTGALLIFKGGKWVGELNTDRQNLKDAADADRKYFREIVAEIREDIKKIFLRLGPAEAVGTSPLRLTGYGRELLAGTESDAANRLREISSNGTGEACPRH